MPAETRRRGRPPKRQRASEASRQELLKAAEIELSTHGYRGATVDGIAARAGLSKGTFYWVFDSKEDVFLALLEESLDAPVRQLMEITRTAPATEPTAGQVSSGLGNLFARDRHLVLLLQEYWAAAARDERVAARYRRRQADLRATLATALATRHERTGVPLTLPADHLAEAFVALATGLGLDAVVDPDAVPGDLFGEIASLVYDGMVLRAERAASPPGRDA